MDGEDRSDEELVRQVSAGDEEAFVALYSRYFEQVYDFAIRIARDRGTAALVVQSTFLRVGQGLRSSAEESAPFKVLLYATARSDLRERLRRRHGPTPEPGEGYDVGDAARLSDPAFAAELPDLARGAWRAALELPADDYELLDLNVRRQLHAGELAAILRSRPDNVERKLVSIRRTFEVSFAALLLFGVGRQACVDLDFVLTDDEWTPALRRRVQRHYQSCQTCQTTRRRYPGATEVLVSLTPVLAPAGWEDAMRDRLVEAIRAGTPAAPPAAVAASVPPPPATRHEEPFEPDFGGGGGPGIGDWLTEFFGGGGSRGPMLAIFGGGLLVFVIVLAAVCTAGAFDGGGDGEDATTPTITPTGSVTLTPTQTGTPTETPTATSPAVGPTEPPPPAEPPASTATTAPTVALPTPTTAPAANTPTPPPPAPTATSPAAPTNTPVPPTAPLPTPTP